ncbi:hypothetical protein C8A00DRAFT_15117, partial [Chaetomidium leptoderma]
NMPDHDSTSSRIAIQLEKPPASSPPHGIKKRARPAHGKRHREHALHEESESESNSDNDGQTHGRSEIITSYDLPGASLDDEKAQRRDGEPATDKHGDATPERKSNESKSSRIDSATAEPESQDQPAKWGLTINMKGLGGNKAGEKKRLKARTYNSESEEDLGRPKKATKTIDDEALDALMGSRTPKRKYADADAADREPRPEDYRSIPIDDFGATLLRNFGWDGKMKGKVREVTRHANLTGLGAKDVKGAEDLGAWNQKTTKDSRPVRLDDYRREESKKRQRTDDRRADSYKRERERERERERDHGRDR